MGDGMMMEEGEVSYLRVSFSSLYFPFQASNLNQ